MQMRRESDSLLEKLRTLHEGLRAEMPQVDRIAVAVYDAKTDTLKTYVNSTIDGDELERHEAKLSEVPSLQRLALTRSDRVIADTSVFQDMPTRHSQAVVANWGSSYTKPLFEGDRLRGFIFFDAKEKYFFQPTIVSRLGVYVELMRLLLVSYLFPARMLHSAVEVASEVSHERDPETGAHLDRMSHYSRLIALGVAPQCRLGDAFIEHILLFSPLHDIGKVAIPDHILLKPARLTDDEMEVMKTHAARGSAMVDRLLTRLELQNSEHGSMLHNIIRHHHELWNGTGYPDALKGTAIPLEARIVTVADVFDALTSERPYKKPWSFDAALAYLQKHAGELYDQDCVNALTQARAAAEGIRLAFVDTPQSRASHEGYHSEL